MIFSSVKAFIKHECDILLCLPFWLVVMHVSTIRLPFQFTRIPVIYMSYGADDDQLYTVPTLYDLPKNDIVSKHKYCSKPRQIQPVDNIIFILTLWPIKSLMRNN